MNTRYRLKIYTEFPFSFFNNFFSFHYGQLTIDCCIRIKATRNEKDSLTWFFYIMIPGSEKNSFGDGSISKAVGVPSS